MVARFITAAFLFLWISAQVYCIINVDEKRFAAIAQPFYFALAFCCSLVVYVCLIGKTKQLDDMIEYMESVANNRMYRITTKSIHLLIYTIFTLECLQLFFEILSRVSATS